MALSCSIPMGWQTARRRFDKEGQLLAQLSDCDLYSGEYPLDDRKLAFSPVSPYPMNVTGWLQLRVCDQCRLGSFLSVGIPLPGKFSRSE